jgi:SAM-dependent methyltransferase
MDAVIQREWQHLFDHFERRVLELKPRSVLDVGCGRGGLIGRQADPGIPATGIDPGANGSDPQIINGDAARMPFGDGAFEWLTLRHVPHHLPDLPAALAECVRVARKGLLIAEPWFDPADPVQQLAERWDRWWKRQHERNGDIHRPCLAVPELTAALPPGTRQIEAEHYRREAAIPFEAIEALSQPLLETLAPRHPDRAEYEAIAQAIREQGFTYNGTLIVKVTL